MLSADAFRGVVRARGVIDAEGDAVVLVEVKFRQIAVNVGFADMVEVAIDAALQDGERTFHGVGMNEAAPGDIISDGVIDGSVRGELGVLEDRISEVHGGARF